MARLDDAEARLGDPHRAALDVDRPGHAGHMPAHRPRPSDTAVDSTLGAEGARVRLRCAGRSKDRNSHSRERPSRRAWSFLATTWVTLRTCTYPWCRKSVVMLRRRFRTRG